MTEDFEQIGWRLRTAREAAGLELDDVVFRTRIPRSVLAALEAEDFSVFTSPIYARSFLGQYGDFLNVDTQPWIDALEPGSFVPAGPLPTLIELPAAPAAEKDDPPEPRAGLLSVLGLLALTVALVLAAIQSQAFFELRPGGQDVAPPDPPLAAAPAAETAVPPETAMPMEMKTVAKSEEEEIGGVPPRAIIVR